MSKPEGTVSSRFDLYVSYSQLAVFRPSLDEPFNTWTDEQVRNGYSWRPESVSFKTPIETGTCTVEIVEGYRYTAMVADAIEVPVNVPNNGKIEVASISDSHIVNIRAGATMLRYEVLEECKLRLTFIYP